jgi:putative component of toxin-antitoxin plasmid stabilization module
MSFALKQWGNEWSDFVASLGSDGAEAKLKTWIEKLADEGHTLRRHVRPLSDGLFELKISHSGMAYRCLYGFHQGAVVIVLCFAKKKQRDQAAIAEARRRLKLVKSGNMEPSDAAIH